MDRRLALFFHLGGDIDLLEPFLGSPGGAQGPRVLVNEKLLTSNPRLSIVLGYHGLSPDVVIAEGAASSVLRAALEGATDLLTASETTLRPHRLAHQLTVEANKLGIRTYTMQHGVENVGLTYFDDRQGADVVFAAQRVLTWKGAAKIPDFVSKETREKILDAGLVVRSSGAFDTWRRELISRLGGKQFTVGVFENLHWTRYSDEYRQRFLDDLEHTARALPGVRFLIKPHPEGRWLTERFGGPKPNADNIVIIDSADPIGRLLTAPDLMPLLGCVVTTPSKTALDASIAGVPAAIPIYDGVCPAYAALRNLEGAEDWRKFINLAAIGARDLELRRRHFIDETVSSLEGVSNILSFVGGSGQAGV